MPLANPNPLANPTIMDRDMGRPWPGRWGWKPSAERAEVHCCCGDAKPPMRPHRNGRREGPPGHAVWQKRRVARAARINSDSRRSQERVRHLLCKPDHNLCQFIPRSWFPDFDLDGDGCGPGCMHSNRWSPSASPKSRRLDPLHNQTVGSGRQSTFQLVLCLLFFPVALRG